MASALVPGMVRRRPCLHGDPPREAQRSHGPPWVRDAPGGIVPPLWTAAAPDVENARMLLTPALLAVLAAQVQDRPASKVPA